MPQNYINFKNIKFGSANHNGPHDDCIKPGFQISGKCHTTKKRRHSNGVSDFLSRATFPPIGYQAL